MAHRRDLERRASPEASRSSSKRPRRSKTTTKSSSTAGIPSVDIIDLDYPAWHRAEDRLDHVAASSLQAVGDVLLDALPAIEAHLK